MKCQDCIFWIRRTNFKDIKNVGVCKALPQSNVLHLKIRSREENSFIGIDFLTHEHFSCAHFQRIKRYWRIRLTRWLVKKSRINRRPNVSKKST